MPDNTLHHLIPDDDSVNLHDADTCAQTLHNIKHALMSIASNSKDSLITEAIPVYSSSAFPIPQDDLDMLHKFANANPIYSKHYKFTLADVQCIIYDGNINRYWLGSILHESSKAPFSPTWIASAYVMAKLAKSLGYCQSIDVGSGDGRIAFCSAILNMNSYSVEIDPTLVNLQKQLGDEFGFKPYCSDAAVFDYADIMDVKLPTVVFIGGLAQMGGTELATAVMSRITSVLQNDATLDNDTTGVYFDDNSNKINNHIIQNIDNFGWVFAGTRSPKYTPDQKGMCGWGSMMDVQRLCHVKTIDLPTAWTLGLPDDTPYVFAAAAACVN